MIPITPLLFLLSLVFSLWTTDASATDENLKIYEITGIVQTILADGRPVIAHDPVPGFMPAMTMAFEVADRDATASLQEGQKVKFQLRVSPTASLASAFEVTGRVAPRNVPPPPSRPRMERLRAGDPLPEFALLDEQSRPLTRESWHGQFTILTFIFTRCPVPEFCPAMALRYSELQTAIKADTALAGRTGLVSITLDPEFDTPEILAAYGEALGADPAVWGFATGTAAQTESLARAFSVYNERNGITLDHTLCTALIGPDGRIIELWRGNHWQAAEILEVLRTQTSVAEQSPCCLGKSALPLSATD